MSTPLSPTQLYEQFQKKGELVLRVKITPRSAFNAIYGLLEDGTVKIRIAAVPEKGKANEELVEFLKEDFGASEVTIISGASDPLKLVRLKK